MYVLTGCELVEVAVTVVDIRAPVLGVIPIYVEAWLTYEVGIVEYPVPILARPWTQYASFGTRLSQFSLIPGFNACR